MTSDSEVVKLLLLDDLNTPERGYTLGAMGH